MKAGDALAQLENRVRLKHYLPDAGIDALRKACGEPTPAPAAERPNTDATKPKASAKTLETKAE